MLAALSLEKHPDKTFIGRIERGFDFLGYHFTREGLRVAKQTIENFIEKASRLYEQERSTPPGASPLEMYASRWLRRCMGGLQMSPATQ
jgi:RNA-directed DNA polymerase